MVTKKKKVQNGFWGHVLEILKHSFTPALMFFTASIVLLLISSKQGENIDLSKIKVWAIVLGLIAVAYNGVLLWACGASHYEQLVSGNVKRLAVDDGREMKISSHSIGKEYRPWKGFVIGLVSCWALIVGGIFLGVHSEKIATETLGTGWSGVMFVFYLLAGYVLVPYQVALTEGLISSGFITLVYVIIPVVVSGACYIAGAYHKRAKVMREQEIAARQAAQTETKTKKINYGGLPGTKPKKKK